MQKIFPPSREEEEIEHFWNFDAQGTANKLKSVCIINNHSYWILYEFQSIAGSSIQLPAYYVIKVLFAIHF